MRKVILCVLLCVWLCGCAFLYRESGEKIDREIRWSEELKEEKEPKEVDVNLNLLKTSERKANYGTY